MAGKHKTDAHELAQLLNQVVLNLARQALLRCKKAGFYVESELAAKSDPVTVLEILRNEVCVIASCSFSGAAVVEL